MPYSFVIVGSPDDSFTSAEISDDGGVEVGKVFELEDGWYVRVVEVEHLKDPELIDAALRAKAALLHYVNRKGADFTTGDWTRAGASLWLMQRDDGKGFTIDPGKKED